MESRRSSTEPRLEEREELRRKNKCRPLGKESLEWGVCVEEGLGRPHPGL